MSTNFNYESRHGYDDIRPKNGRHRTGAATIDAATGGYDDISKPVRPYRPRVAPAEAAAAPERGTITPESIDDVEDIETFEQAERMHNELSDRTIVQMLNGELSGDHRAIPGNMDIKSWADNVEAGRDEIELAKNPAKIARLHAQTAGMIARNQLIYFDPGRFDGKSRAYLQQQKRAYTDRLQADDGVKLEHAIHQWDRNPRDARGVGVALHYSQMVFQTGRGNVDITDRFAKPIDGMRAKISIQEELGGSYIHWFTDKFAREAVENGHTTKPTHRIYLSPPPESTPQAFEAIMKALDGKGFSVTGKMLDRATEAALRHQEARKGDHMKTRADGIVIAMDKRDADEVLKFIKEVHSFNNDLFKDRPTPKMAMRIGDGLAVGAEPVQNGESLTSHRCGILGDTVTEVREQLGVGDDSDRKISLVASARARTLFRRIWNQKARAAHINPRNMSFNS